MRLMQLKYFQAVCKYYNMTRAAAELHVSQPSLSNAIHELEEEFGITLFYRRSKGIALTEQGKIFLEESEKLLEHADSFCEQMWEMGSAKHSIKLGVPYMLSAIVFPQLFAAFCKEYPESRLQMVENGTLTNKAMILEGTLDAAMVSSDQSLGPSFRSCDLCSRNFYFYVSADHPLARCREVSLEDIADIPLALLPEDSFLTSYIYRCYKKMDQSPNVIVKTNQIAAIQRMVESNAAATFFFDDVMDESRKVTKIPVRDCSEIQILLIWNANRKLSVGTRQLIELARKEFRGK